MGHQPSAGGRSRQSHYLLSRGRTDPLRLDERNNRGPTAGNRVRASHHHGHPPGRLIMPEDISNLELVSRAGGYLYFKTVPSRNIPTVLVYYYPEGDRIAISNSGGVFIEAPHHPTPDQKASILAAILRSEPKVQSLVSSSHA